MRLQHAHSRCNPTRNAGRVPPHEWSFRAGVAIDIKFGTAGPDCRFHGICRLDLGESEARQPEPLRCDSARGWLFLPSPAYCLICIDKCSLTEARLKTHLSRNCFELPQKVTFSEMLTRRVGCRAELLPGKYRIREKGQVYSILFGVMTNEFFF